MTDRQPPLIDRLKFYLEMPAAVLFLAPFIALFYLLEWYGERRKQKEIEELNEKIHD